jgi:hypothetical protein
MGILRRVEGLGAPSVKRSAVTATDRVLSRSRSNRKKKRKRLLHEQQRLTLMAGGLQDAGKKWPSFWLQPARYPAQRR